MHLMLPTYPPALVNKQTPVKTLPSGNFVCGGPIRLVQTVLKSAHGLLLTNLNILDLDPDPHRIAHRTDLYVYSSISLQADRNIETVKTAIRKVKSK